MSDLECVRLWVPGRRTKKIAIDVLASFLIGLTVLGGIAQVVPGIVNAFFPALGPGLSTQGSVPGTNTLSNSGPGLPLPPGTVQFGSRATPFSSQIVDSSVPPHLTTTRTDFVYQTTFGTYSFNRSAPFVFRLRARDGSPLTSESFFFVNSSSGGPVPGSASVGISTDNQFQVSYGVLRKGSIVGTLTLQVDFQASVRPKFSISLSKTPSWSLGDFNIVWATFTVSQWVNPSNGGMIDIQAVASVQRVTGTSRIDSGPSPDRDAWTNWITTDWTDAPGGRLEVGYFSLGGLSGKGHIVIFETNQSKIDPTQVATSTVNYATAYSTQRKDVSYGGKYFLFYYSGSNIMWKSTVDEVNWSGAFVAGGGTGYSGTIGYNFDLYQSGSTIALAWLSYNSGAGGDGTTALYFRKGTVFAGDISWTAPTNVATWGQPYSWPPSVAIGNDGTFWTAGIWQDSNGRYNVWVYRSTDGVSFALSTNYLTSNSASRYEALQLVPLTQGRVLALSSHYYDQTVRWTTWNPSSPTGPYWSSIQTYNATLPANTYKWNLMSTTMTPDGLVHMIFQQYAGSSSWNLGWASYNVTTNQWIAGQRLQGGVSLPVYPSISSDRLGNLYALWTNQGDTSTYDVWYTYRSKGDLSWTVPQTPFVSVSNATWISASRASSKEVMVTWTRGTGSPNSIFYGSIPLPSGIASSPPVRPWSKLGLSPYEQYFAQNSEYVSPGNGLLTINQPDISVAGRNGLSLSLTRVFSQPFTFITQPYTYIKTPFNYETSPYTNLGNGWQFNLPWVATQNLQGAKYLHYLNGEIFPIIWNNITTIVSGDVIGTLTMTNHQTEDFVLNETMDLTTNTIQNYKLVAKDGTAYNFNSNGVLTTVVDRTGQNQISFGYWPSSPYYLSNITDTVGRVATLKYSSNYLANVTYGGQTVRYGYNGNNLVTVSDAVGRVTALKYSPLSAWLLSGLVYPAGGNCTYTYGSTTIGTDITNYYVTLQTVYLPGQVVKSSSFSYNITDGEITSTSVTQSDGQSVQGYTNYLYNSQSSSMTRSVLNATLVRTLKDQFWYDPTTGRSVQQDVYSGSSLSRSFFNSHFYDLWGNVVYARDNVGHESYSSFANSDSQYMFQSPGSLTTTTSGKKLYDDFNGPSLNTSAWVQGGSGTSKITAVSSGLLKLALASSSQGSWRSNWVRTAGTYNYPFYAEVQMENWYAPGTDTISADLFLSPQAVASNGNPFDSSNYLRMALRDYPSYKIFDRVAGGTENLLWSDTSTGTHSISWKIIMTDRNTLTVYLNRGKSIGYELVYSTTTLGLSSTFTPSYAYLSFANLNTATYYATFDYLGLSTSNSLTVNGLQSSQKVELYDWNDALQTSGTVAFGQSSLVLDATQMPFPYGYFKIYEADSRTLQYVSPTREVWGGSTYSYTRPFKSGGDTRTSTGFLQSSTVYVDDAVPSGATSYSDGGDGWAWATSSLGPVVSGSQSHLGFFAPGTHEHYFNGSTTTLSAAQGSYLIQYVYIPSSAPPSEIMLQFHTVSGTWEHRAYWGSNSITACGTTGSTCGTNGTPSRLPMGPIPQVQNSWVMLIVKTDDVAVSGLNINGWSYTLYNGGVYWDYSALGISTTGTITINNLLASQKIEVYDSTNALKVSGTVPTGQTSVTLNLYGSGITAFPFKAYMKIYAASGPLQYSSPIMADIWGGDIYNYNQPVFSNLFNAGTAPGTIHVLPIGLTQYQNATSTPEERYSNFDAAGNLLQENALHNGSPLASTYTYDSYGNRLSSVNPDGEKTYYTYSAIYQYSALSSLTRVLSPTINVTSNFVYDFTTLETLTRIDPMANRTDFAYDQIRRTTLITEAPIGGVRPDVEMVYEDASDSFGIENQKGNYTDFSYDGLGRITTINHHVGNLTTPIIATERYTYDWQGHVKSYTAPDGNVTTYAYDYLGRSVKVTNPDLSYHTTFYDDTNLIQSNFDENQHRTVRLYDALHRLIGVREYYSASNYYSTSYTYDAIGNLAKTVDALGQTTTSAYDDLNRLILTRYPDDFSETRTYDNIGNLLSKKDPNGNTITYSYDNLNRQTNINYPDSTKTTFAYDKNGNMISISNSKSSATFSYDSRNRLSTETWTITGNIYVIVQLYDAVGNQVATIYPDSTAVSFSYDPLNRVAGVKTGSTTLANISYTSDSTISTLSYGNGVQTKYTYDSRTRTKEIRTTQGSNVLLDLNYTYDPAGNVQSINTESYSYDYLNRLTYASGPWGVLKYGYDSVGNRLWMYQSPTNTTYSYGAYDRLSSVGSTSYTYDNNGNRLTQVTGGTTTRYNYDFENRLTSVTQAASTLGNYTYDPLGKRVQKVESGSTTTYLNSGVNVVYEQAGSTVSDYVFVGKLLIAKLSGGSIYYFHQDTLGSTRLVTTGSTTSFSTNYQPFGPQYGASGTDPNYKYTGKPQDIGTGLYYYGARYYDGSTGRFISRDPAKPSVGDPESSCPYPYVRNNPLKFTDPTGACVDAFGLASSLVGFILTLAGLEWEEFFAPFDFLAQVSNFVLDYLPRTIQYLSAGSIDVVGLVLDVVIPNFYSIASDALRRLFEKGLIGLLGEISMGAAMAAEVGTGAMLVKIAAATIVLGIDLGIQLAKPPESGRLCSDFMEQPPLIRVLMRPSSLDYYHEYHQFHFSIIEASPWGYVGGIGGATSKGGPAGI